MPVTATEREVKLDVPTDWRLPDLSGVAGVAGVEDTGEHRLVATYLDTADHRLLASHATFRRRTGGADAGWHVKLPSDASGARIEVRREHRRPPKAAPAELVDLVAARTRGVALVPVMELVTVRHLTHLVGPDGAVLAEVADDHVTATRPGAGDGDAWREVEVELVTGDETVLDAAVSALLAAGATRAAGPSKLGRALGEVPSARAAVARPRSVGGLLLGYLRAQVDALVDADTRVRLDRPEGIHDLRVATRRLRSALATHRGRFDAAMVDDLRGRLQALATSAAAARDAEVLAERLPAEVEALPTELRTPELVRRVHDDLTLELAQAKADLRAALADPEHLRLLDDLAAMVAGPVVPARVQRAGSRPPGARASVDDELRRVRRAVATARRLADADALPTALHEIRKAAKRARYAAELVAPKVGGPAVDLAERLSGIQDLLGLHQDDVVAREHVRRLARAAHEAGEDTFALGVLHEDLPADHAAVLEAARRAVRQAHRSWRS